MKVNADERNFTTTEEIADDLYSIIYGWSDDRQLDIIDNPGNISYYCNDYYHDYLLTFSEINEITEVIVDWLKSSATYKRLCYIMYNNAVDGILDSFDRDEDLFNDVVEELDGVNGYLGDDRYYSMDEIDELFSYSSASEIIARAIHGHDENYFLDASGNRTYSPFNLDREYFKFNGYGNLVSADYKDYSSYRDKYLISSIVENREDLFSINDNYQLSKMFDDVEKYSAELERLEAAE